MLVCDPNIRSHNSPAATAEPWQEASADLRRMTFKSATQPHVDGCQSFTVLSTDAEESLEQLCILQPLVKSIPLSSNFDRRFLERPGYFVSDAIKPDKSPITVKISAWKYLENQRFLCDQALFKAYLNSARYEKATEEETQPT